MKSYVFILVCLASLLIGIGCGNNPTDPPENSGANIEWVSTAVLYDTTITKKDYSLILFVTSWCGWCTQMEQVTMIDPRVATIMNESFNCAKIDIEANTQVMYFDSLVTCQQFAGIYGVSSIPQTHILDRTGTWLGKIDGYRAPDSYASLLDAIRNGSLDP
jgi:thioredoxin-related protein